MAVDSFLAFKKLMVKRNQELNRQAVELYKKLQGDASAAATDKPTATGAPATATTDGKPAADEETKKAQEELKEVMRVAHSLERAEEEEMMKRALEESEKLKSEE